MIGVQSRAGPPHKIALPEFIRDGIAAEVVIKGASTRIHKPVDIELEQRATGVQNGVEDGGIPVNDGIVQEPVGPWLPA